MSEKGQSLTALQRNSILPIDEGRGGKYFICIQMHKFNGLIYVTTFILCTCLHENEKQLSLSNIFPYMYRVCMRQILVRSHQS